MLTTTVAVLLLLAVLGAFVAIGLGARPSRDSEQTLDTTEFTLAPGSQGPARLGWSFLASGVGAWILFAPPELGAILGWDAVLGYAIAASAPFLVFALVGPRLRRVIPHGRGLNEFVRVRFGPAAGTVLALLSLLYMGVFVAAELVAVGGLGAILGGIEPAVTILAVVVATLAYTAWGGLRASLRTDAWQSWLVVVLLVVAGVAVVTSVDRPFAAAGDLGLNGIDRAGFETMVTLVIAVTAANLFHHGYWQRVWSARDDDALRRGALFGAGITFPVMLVAGAFGVVAAGAGVAEVPALSIFALAAGLPTVVVAAVFALGVALVASSVDTLENGLAALMVAERPTVSLFRARVATVLIIVPAVGASLVVDSVLQLFLIADLLCAAMVAPALLGLWRRTTTAAVVTGALAGLVGAFAGGWLAAGTFAGAVDAVTFPTSVPTYPPFLGALVASTVVTVGVSLAADRTADLSTLDAAVQARATA